MDNLKIGNTPLPISEREETRSESVEAKQTLEKAAPLDEPKNALGNVSQTLESGLKEHILKQADGGMGGEGAPKGNLNNEARPASEWLLERGKLTESEGVPTMAMPGRGAMDPLRPGLGRNLDALSGVGSGNLPGEGIPDIPLTNRPGTIIQLPAVKFDEVSGKASIPIPDLSSIFNNPTPASTPNPQPDPGPIPSPTGITPRSARRLPNAFAGIGECGRPRGWGRWSRWSRRRRRGGWS